MLKKKSDILKIVKLPAIRVAKASGLRITAKPIEMESYFGTKFYVFKNPIPRQAQHLALKYKLGLRGIIKDYDFYIWDADTIIHDDMADNLGIKKPYYRVLISYNKEEASGYKHPKLYISKVNNLSIILEDNVFNDKKAMDILYKYFPDSGAGHILLPPGEY